MNTFLDTNDAELLKHFEQRRDQAAFAELVRRHGGMVLATVRRIVQRQQDAEDAYQATFFALAKSARSLRKQSALASRDQ